MSFIVMYQKKKKIFMEYIDPGGGVVNWRSLCGFFQRYNWKNILHNIIVIIFILRINYYKQRP